MPGHKKKVYMGGDGEPADIEEVSQWNLAENLA
jgi:hypothetical protein